MAITKRDVIWSRDTLLIVCPKVGKAKTRHKTTLRISTVVEILSNIVEIVLYCIVLYCIALYCIALHRIASHCITLHSPLFSSLNLHILLLISIKLSFIPGFYLQFIFFANADPRWTPPYFPHLSCVHHNFRHQSHERTHTDKDISHLIFECQQILSRSGEHIRFSSSEFNKVVPSNLVLQADSMVIFLAGFPSLTLDIFASCHVNSMPSCSSSLDVRLTCGLIVQILIPSEQFPRSIRPWIVLQSLPIQALQSSFPFIIWSFSRQFTNMEMVWWCINFVRVVLSDLHRLRPQTSGWIKFSQFPRTAAIPWTSVPEPELHRRRHGLRMELPASQVLQNIPILDSAFGSYPSTRGHWRHPVIRHRNVIMSVPWRHFWLLSRSAGHGDGLEEQVVGGSAIKSGLAQQDRLTSLAPIHGVDDLLIKFDRTIRRLLMKQTEMINLNTIFKVLQIVPVWNGVTIAGKQW